MNSVETEAAPDLRTEVHQGTKRVRERTEEMMEEWFRVCDHILDIHRTHFLRREPTAAEMEEHKVAVGESLGTCRLMSRQLSSGSTPEDNLLRRLQIRTRQLQDAYDTFHDRTFSDQDAARILDQAFPNE